MKPSMLDTDILSEFLRGNPKIIIKVDEYLKEFGKLSFSVITYYEITNGLLYKDAKKQLKRFESFSKICQVIPLTINMANTAAKIQAELLKKGERLAILTL